jgi:hypothetical protein
MSGGRPPSKPTELEAVVVQDGLPVASEAKRDLVRFMLPILVPEVDWEAVEGALAEGRQCTMQRREAQVRELEDRIARLQSERMSLLREAV